jgi:hypothetical protein
MGVQPCYNRRNLIDKDDDGDEYARARSQQVAGGCKAMTRRAEIHSRVVNDEFDRRRAVTANEKSSYDDNEGGTANPLALWVGGLFILQFLCFL